MSKDVDDVLKFIGGVTLGVIGGKVLLELLEQECVYCGSKFPRVKKKCIRCGRKTI